MYQDITVLVAIADQEQRTKLASTIETLGFDTRTCSDIRGAMDATDCDILLLGDVLANGSSVFTLEWWKTKGASKPVVILTKAISLGDRARWMKGGAWNLLVLDEDEEVLMTHLQRYAEYVLLRREVPVMKAKIDRITRWLFVAVAVALVVGGERAIELLRSLPAILK
jgi:DNA-binding NtrC family response regulator